MFVADSLRLPPDLVAPQPNLAQQTRGPKERKKNQKLF